MTIAEKLQTIAENELKVYNAGYEKGKAEGGGDSYYDEFWDIIQENGNRTNYNTVFCGKAWTAETFKPKYPIKPSNATNMFQFSGITTNDYIKSVDFSGSVSMNSVFYNSDVTELGVIDCSKTVSGWSGAVSCFVNCKQLKSIEKIIPPPAGVNFDAFRQCYALTDIVFEGDVASTTNLQESTLLSKASITSLINALSTTTSGLSITLSKTAVNTAFNMTDDNPSEEWSKLIEPKGNWTITLI